MDFFTEERAAQMRAHLFLNGRDQGDPQFDGQDPTEIYHELTPSERKDLRAGRVVPDALNR